MSSPLRTEFHKLIWETTAHPIRLIVNLKKEQRFGLEASFRMGIMCGQFGQLGPLEFRKKPPNELIYDCR